MPRDILSEYGPDSSQPQAGVSHDGGKMDPKPTDYSPPVGPTNINDPKGPGIHGTNHGNAPGQGHH